MSVLAHEAFLADFSQQKHLVESDLNLAYSNESCDHVISMCFFCP